MRPSCVNLGSFDLGLDCGLDRIKGLIRDPVPMHYGLDRTLAELRKEIADVEARRAVRSR